jgi:hypothetical protein
VPVEIYDGTALLDTVDVDQQVDGGQWNVLGTYQFNSGTAEVKIISEGGCTTSADAVRLLAGTPPALNYIEVEGPSSVNENATATYQVRAYYVGGSSQLVAAESWSEDSVFADISTGGVLSTAAVDQDESARITATYTENGQTESAFLDIMITDFSGVVIDDGDPGTTEIGTWYDSSGADPYGTGSRFAKTSSASYSYQTSASGTMEVSLWWTEFSNRCTEVPVEIYDGTALLDTVDVDQQVDGGQWNVLGTYQFNSGTAQVKIISEGGCTTSADAAQLILTGGN